MVYDKAITLKQLRALAAVAEAGSLTGAAEMLHVTPPAVSTQLKTLEQNLGAAPLRRGVDGRFAPTPQGREAMAAIDQIEHMLELCLRRIAALNAGKAGHVSLGVVSTGKYFAPGLVARARDALPDLEVGLKVGNRGDIVAALESRAIDLAIMGRPPLKPSVEADELGEHPHILVAPPGHPLAGGADAPTEQILRQTFLCREPGSGTRILMERFLDQIGEGRVYETIELGTNETIKQAVIAGLGVAVLSAHTVAPELESGRLSVIRHPDLPLVRHWFLVRRADSAPSAAAAAFRAFLLDLDGGYLPPLPQAARP